MRLVPLRIPGTFRIEPEPVRDERGLFARTWCAETFRQAGLDPCLAQCSTSFNRKKGTLRGMHVQVAPHGEAKLVRCTRGRAFDVLCDLRPRSPTFGQWEAVILSARNRLAVYLPEGVAHGFQCLEDKTEIYYQMNVPFSAAHARGLRWDDPEVAIAWPLPDAPILSERDRALPGLAAWRAPLPSSPPGRDRREAGPCSVGPAFSHLEGCTP